MNPLFATRRLWFQSRKSVNVSGFTMRTFCNMPWVSVITRGHSLKLVKCRCNKYIRKFLFSYRVVSKWNMLNNHSVTAKTVNGFKTKLERERAKKMGLFWTDVCWTSRP